MSNGKTILKKTIIILVVFLYGGIDAKYRSHLIDSKVVISDIL